MKLHETIRERHHRLPADLYVGFVVVAFTACVKNRMRLFEDPEMVKRFEKILLQEIERYHCDALVYLFMPDHLHLILQGKAGDAEPLKAMNSFKQKTGYRLAENFPHIHWQKDYYDHIIKTEEDIIQHIGYILNNPVRKGIVDNWTRYTFSGSTVYRLDELML